MELYFAVLHHHKDVHGDDCVEIRAATVLSYLILPSIQTAMITSTGPGEVSYFSSTFIDPSIIQQPTFEHIARFRDAMSILGLYPTLRRIQHPTTWPTSKPSTTLVPPSSPKHKKHLKSVDIENGSDETVDIASLGEVRVPETSLMGKPANLKQRSNTVQGLRIGKFS